MLMSFVRPGSVRDMLYADKTWWARTRAYEEE